MIRRRAGGRSPAAALACIAWGLAYASLCAAAHPAATPPMDNVDLSPGQPELAAGVPVVAVDPERPNRVAVAWRFIDPVHGPGTRLADGAWECHLSLSEDGGKTFADHTIAWHLDSISRCNAPWVGFSTAGDVYLAATLTGAPPEHAVPAAASDAPATHAHPVGTVGLMVSRDGGRSWNSAVSAIPSNALDRFDTDASIPITAKQVPWDGAKGALDLATHTLYLSGAFPAPPGGADHSQRFYSASTNQGATFGAIFAFGNAQWPERWDGDIAAAGGTFIASYIGDSTPLADTQCPCALVALSRDGGRIVTHRFVAGRADLDVDTIVHYPEVAADPRHRHRFAVATISAQKNTVGVFVTRNDGEAWSKSSLTSPADVSAVTRPAVAYSPDGIVVVAWRGVHADGSYDIFAAASADGQRFGLPIRVSTQSSLTPDAWRGTYAVRGDFHTSVAASRTVAHLAWADARSGNDVRAMYGSVALPSLLP